ncbi:MAG: MFS transporter [Brevinematales bacterium]|jgi:MFS family permease
MSFRTFLAKIDNKDIRRGLYYSNLDGIVWAVMFGLAENFIVPFALLFGASVFQVSLITGFGQLGIGLSQLAGARFINWMKKRKLLCIICNIIHASSWVLMFVVTALTRNPWFVVIFYCMGLTASNFGSPGWLSWMHDLMPNKVRGEYWGIRNRFMGIAQLLSITFAGIILYTARKNNLEEAAFGFLLIAGFASRFSSAFLLKRQYEPPMKVTEESHTFKFYIFLTKLFTTNFGRFVFFSILITFSTNMVGPILPVYFLQTVHMNYLQFTAVMMAGAISSFIFMTYWGPLSDKYGSYRVLIISSLALPIVGLGWALVRDVYMMIVLQVFSGFVWAGVNLATSNFIFDAVRKENISKIMSYFNMLNTLCLFLGAAAGGAIADFLLRNKFSLSIFNGFTIVFLFSAVLRTVLIAAFRGTFKEVRETEKSPKFHYFYIYKPALEMLDFIQETSGRIFRSRSK